MHVLEERLRKLLAAMAIDIGLGDKLKTDDFGRVYNPNAITGEIHPRYATRTIGGGLTRPTVTRCKYRAHPSDFVAAQTGVTSGRPMNPCPVARNLRSEELQPTSAPCAHQPFPSLAMVSA